MSDLCDLFLFFFFNDTATTEIYTLSLHDALPIFQVSTAPFKSAGLAFVSGSATRTSLTTDGTRRGYFFRVVPNDDQQGPRVANYIRGQLRHTRVAVVDAQNSYSTGLADTVQRILRAGRVNVQRRSEEH